MYVESVELNNFRNFKNLEIDLDSGTNILYGNNAQGKTNLLEAIYISGTTKSHKGSRDKEVIRFGKEESHIRIIVRKKESSYKIDLHLKKNKPKGIAINGVPIKKASELLGVVNMVFFSPEDLNMIKNGPSERRKFINMELGQLDKIYLYHLVNYNKALNQRNSLLKEIPYRNDLKDTLFVWDEQLLKFGIPIINRRKEFVKQLNEIVKEIHFKLSGEKEHLFIDYEPDTDEESFEKKLIINRERDYRMKTTTVGPHRDDLIFLIENVDIRKYGSQGQQRTAALSMKLAEIELVRNVIDDTPVLLLDDVLSELDSSRQNDLLDSIHDIQTLLTCTGLEEFISHQFPVNKVFHVKEGKIKEMKVNDQL